METKEEGKPVFSNGDCFDEDSGEYLATLTYPTKQPIPDHPDEEEMILPPAKMSVFIKGQFYIYKMDSKVDAKETNDVEEPKKI